MAKRGRNIGEEANEEDKKKKLNRESITKTLRVFRFVKPYRTQFALGFVFLVLVNHYNA